MLKTILIAIPVVIAGVLAYAATLPDTFHVSRSLEVHSPRESVFPLIADMQRFNTWNPFNKKDPNIKGTYSGPTSGPGAKYAFEGNNDVGSGDLAIVDVASPSRVTMKLDMLEPMRASNNITFTLEPDGQGTRVTWAMEGQMPYIGKVMHLVFNMDKMVGKDFENGLANLKALAEKSAG